MNGLWTPREYSELPSCELSYPLATAIFCVDDFAFPQVGYIRSGGGYTFGIVVLDT